MTIKKNKYVEEIILQNKLCITDNPKGLTKLWPKSYVKKFYNSNFFKKNIFSCERLLEINCSNPNQKILWLKLKPNLIIDECKITEINSLKKKKFSYNIIIFNKILENKNLKYILNILSLLDKKGILIIEDCGQSFLFILNLFIRLSYNYNIRIEDYRLDRFLRNNCLLKIYKYESNNLKLPLEFLINLCKIIFYLIIELLILLEKYMIKIK